MCSPSAPSAPTSTSQTTIPEYAKPYAESMLGKAQALTETPYQTYGGERVAGATPEQQAARQSVAGMELPGQFAAGTGLAGAGGLQGLAAGQTYMGMATSPQAQQAFMSPYIQGVVDVQKRKAIEDAQKAQLMQNLGAARQGTYGGARQLLAGTERERSLTERLADIQATGLQQAYDRAQQAMQFGTTAGLQGAQAATQAGATLGQLGIGQQQQALDLAKAQEAFGAMGQAERQKLMDLQYQDYLQQQQYPYKQLGFMSDILRGSANLAATGGKTVYEPPPSVASQLGGLGLAGLGVYNLLK